MAPCVVIGERAAAILQEEHHVSKEQSRSKGVKC